MIERLLAGGLLALLVASSACTVRVEPLDFPDARRDCPTGLVRADSDTFDGAFDRMDGRVPTVLPEGFGVAEAWGEGEGALGQVLFVDARCREIFVATYDGRQRLGRGASLGRWVVTSSGPRDCGNAVLGDARCLRYGTHMGGKTIAVLTMGLERSEADGVVRSIPLGD